MTEQKKNSKKKLIIASAAVAAATAVAVPAGVVLHKKGNYGTPGTVSGVPTHLTPLHSPE